MLKGKVALVTGGSRGIGRGIALQLGGEGATVYITGRKPRNKATPPSEAEIQQADDQTSDDQPATIEATESVQQNEEKGTPGRKTQEEDRTERIEKGLKELQDNYTLEKTARDVTERGGKGVVVYCDHSNPEEVKALFEQIQTETNGQLDILVNNAYSAANQIMENSGKKFWELDPGFWDSVNNVGLRNHYYCSVYAARLMVPRKQGLIVTLSSAGGLQYIFNVCYGVGKAAKDRLAADMAHELRESGVASVSLWPGAVKTEMATKILGEATPEDLKSLSENREEILSKPMTEMFVNGESTEYAGKCVVHLATDKNLMKLSGKILLTTDLGNKYGFKDIDGKRPPNMRSMSNLLKLENHKILAKIVPSGIKLPGWALSAGTSQL